MREEVKNYIEELFVLTQEQQERLEGRRTAKDSSLISDWGSFMIKEHKDSFSIDDIMEAYGAFGVPVKRTQKTLLEFISLDGSSEDICDSSFASYIKGIASFEKDRDDYLRSLHDRKGVGVYINPLLEDYYLDSSCAKRFEESNKDIYYFNKSNSWLLYNSDLGIFREEDSGIMSKMVFKYFDEESNLLYKNFSNSYKYLVKNVSKLSQSFKMNAILSALKALYASNINDVSLEREDYKITVSNGVVDLYTGKLLPFDKKYFSIHRSPVEYKGPTYVKNPITDRILSAISKEERDYVQIVFGQAITGESSPHLWAMLGNGGNGKSLFLSALKTVMGSYCDILDSKIFQDNGATNFERIRMMGLRIAYFEELSSKDSLNFLSKANCFVTSNNLPYVKSANTAMVRRLRVLDFIDSYQSRSNYGLSHGLLGDFRHSSEAQSSFLSWLIEGSIRYLNNRASILDIPESIRVNSDEEVLMDSLRGDLERILDITGDMKECVEIKDFLSALENILSIETNTRKLAKRIRDSKFIQASNKVEFSTSAQRKPKGIIISRFDSKSEIPEKSLYLFGARFKDIYETSQNKDGI